MMRVRSHFGCSNIGQGFVSNRSHRSTLSPLIFAQNPDFETARDWNHFEEADARNARLERFRFNRM